MSVVSFEFAAALKDYTEARDEHRRTSSPDALKRMWHALNHCHHYGRRNIALRDLLTSMRSEYVRLASYRAAGLEIVIVMDGAA